MKTSGMKHSGKRLIAVALILAMMLGLFTGITTAVADTKVITWDQTVMLTLCARYASGFHKYFLCGQSAEERSGKGTAGANWKAFSNYADLLGEYVFATNAVTLKRVEVHFKYNGEQEPLTGKNWTREGDCYVWEGDAKETDALTPAVYGVYEIDFKIVDSLPGNPPQTSLSKAVIAKIPDQTYTGKAIKPQLTVTCEGKKLKEGTDYKVSYINNKDVGKAAVTIAGKGDYYGAASATFLIVPKAVELSSLEAGEKALTAKWKKGSGIDGYEIEYSLKKNFKDAKTVTIKDAKTTEHTIQNLKAKKTYYVRIRAFRKAEGKKYYSAWSKAMSKKTR